MSRRWREWWNEDIDPPDDPEGMGTRLGVLLTFVVLIILPLVVTGVVILLSQWGDQ